MRLLTYFHSNTFKRRALTVYLPEFSAMASESYSTTKRPKVYITRSDCPSEGINMLKEKCDIEMWKEATLPVPREELLRSVKGKDALFCLLTDKIDKDLLDSAGPSLKVIATLSVGYDHIDVPEVKKRGIKLGFTPDVLSNAVAELTIALLLATSRRLFESHQEILDGGWGSWTPLWMCGPGLDRSTVGIVGLGRIGQEVAKRLKSFNVSKMLYSGTSDKPEAATLGATRVDLHELLCESDFVIVTCALNPATKEMCNDDFFSKMKSSAIFVNTSRGGLVDQDALLRALQCGKIAGAGLDVMTPEPLPPDHALLKQKNCVIIPHIGSATYQAREAMCVLTAQNIIHGLDGKPLPAEV